MPNSSRNILRVDMAKIVACLVNRHSASYEIYARFVPVSPSRVCYDDLGFLDTKRSSRRGLVASRK